MRLLIDGYNLLHATDLFGAGELAGTLRGSREALIGFLAERLTSKERRGTVIVFDAADAPPGLPDRYEHQGIDLRFARGYADADSMIEAILDGVHGAKHLTVVSGDRRVQRAARSSGAKWSDSGPWFNGLCQRESSEPRPAVAKPADPIGSNADWVAEFDDPDALAAIEREADEAPLPPPPAPPASTRPPSESAPASPPQQKKRKRRPPLDEPSDKPRGAFGAGLNDPFPPGYGEDLLDESDIGPKRSDRDS